MMVGDLAGPGEGQPISLGPGPAAGQVSPPRRALSPGDQDLARHAQDVRGHAGQLDVVILWTSSAAPRGMMSSIVRTPHRDWSWATGGPWAREPTALGAPGTRRATGWAAPGAGPIPERTRSTQGGDGLVSVPLAVCMGTEVQPRFMRLWVPRPAMRDFRDAYPSKCLTPESSLGAFVRTHHLCVFSTRTNACSIRADASGSASSAFRLSKLVTSCDSGRSMPGGSTRMANDQATGILPGRRVA